MAEALVCPQCEKTIPANAPMGLCPACLMQLALASDESAFAEVQLPPQTPAGLADETPPPMAVFVTQPASSAAGATPAHVPGYEILGELGRGGMGVVYKARQLKLNRIVALKMILAGGQAGEAALARFRTEAEAIARLQHPNIVQVHDVGEHEGKPYFSLEFCAGGSLAQKVAGTPLPPKAAAWMVEMLARGMAAAHHKAIIHRDLKPANVLLLEDGTPKITDFGLAKKLDDPGQTQSGAIMGTPSYMAPEQASGKTKEIGPPVDIYALGAILYELLTGRPPFKATTELETVMQVVNDDPVPPSQLQSKTPRDLETICLKCLQKEPARRYASAGALAEDLRRFQAGEPILARPVGKLERAWRSARRNPTATSFAAITMLLVFGLLAGGIWYQREDSRRQTEQLLRKADETRKQALAEQSIGAALDQAEKSRAELHQILRQPGGVFRLLNEPKLWQAQIQAAQGAVDRAKALLANAESPVEPDLSTRIQQMETLLGQDEADRQLALRLEKIRMDFAIVVEDNFDFATAARQYPRAFAEAKLPVLEADRQEVANQIGSSLIKEQLVAALDFWAWLAGVTGKKDLVEPLLEVARLANPDPELGDRLRQLKVWQDRNALTILAKETRIASVSPDLLVLVGTLLEANSLEQEIWLRNAQAHYPADFWLNLELGNAISKNKPVQAEGFYRAALAVRPGSAAAYFNLGFVLGEQKRPSEAIAAYQKAIDLDPKHAQAYFNLGVNLGNLKRLPEVTAAYEKAIALDPKFTKAYYNLGHALYEQKLLAEATVAYQKSIALDPKYAEAHGGLGQALLQQGSFADAAAATQKALDLLPAGHPLREFAQDQHRQCQALIAMEKRLPLVLESKDAANPVELLGLAGMCQLYKKHHASAVRLYQRAFRVNPGLADDLAGQYRHNAACAAALAGCGLGRDVAKLTQEEKSQLRRQARDWLNADLHLYAKQMKVGNAGTLIQATERLSHWQQDADFATVRNLKELAKLPKEEGKLWQKLWGDIAGLLKEARSRFSDIRLEAELTENDKSKVHPWNMVAGRLYVIDLESVAFDTFLKLEDPQGKFLAENDDIVPGVNLNSRLFFTAPRDGSYRIIATSFEHRGIGRFTLQIREFTAMK